MKIIKIAAVYIICVYASFSLVYSSYETQEIEWILYHPKKIPHTPGGMTWREVNLNGDSGPQRFRYQVRYNGWVEVDSKTFTEDNASELQWRWKKTISSPLSLNVYFPRTKESFAIFHGSLAPIGVEGECRVTTDSNSMVTSRYDQTFQIQVLSGFKNYRSAVLFASFKIQIEHWDSEKEGWKNVGKIFGLSRTWTNVWFVGKEGINMKPPLPVTGTHEREKRRN